MVKKTSKISTRTYLYIIVVLLIVLGGYLIFTNLPESVDYLTPEQINLAKQNYIDKTVTVIGDYNIFDAGYPIVLTPSSIQEEDRYIKLNLSRLTNNETDDLFQGEKYYFTGKIVREFPDNPILIDKIVLIVEELERV